MTAGQPITSYEQAWLTDGLVFSMIQLGSTEKDIIVALCERHRQMVEKEMNQARVGPLSGIFIENPHEGPDNHPCDDWK